MTLYALPPGTPTGLVATPGGGQASIAFTAPGNTGGEILNYEYSIDSGATWAARFLAATTANGCAAIAVTTVAGQDRCNLVGNPFPYNVDWAQVRVRIKNSGGTEIGTYTPSQAAGVAANGYTVELLIPAEESTHAQVAPASETELASRAHPWYRVWLDWLIPPAAADDAAGFAPGRHPAARPLRGRAPPAAAAAPVAGDTDPTLDLLTAQGVAAEGLDPAQAERAAHATALAEGREWYLRLNVDEPATGYRDHNSVLGQLLGARNGRDPRDLAELPPFGTPYLTLVFPHAGWGVNAGDYASDFRSAQRLSGGNPVPGLPAADWAFEIRTDRPGTPVVLTWEGPPAIRQDSRLIDRTTGRTLIPTAKANLKGYRVTLTTGKGAFTWRYLGQP